MFSWIELLKYNKYKKPGRIDFSIYIYRRIFIPFQLFLKMRGGRLIVMEGL
jgi:hypothetical protein